MRSFEKKDKNYCVDEAKLTVGVIKDESGKLKAGIAAKFFFFSGEAGGEKTQRLISRQLIEVTIKRKEQAPQNRGRVPAPREHSS